MHGFYALKEFNNLSMNIIFMKIFSTFFEVYRVSPAVVAIKDNATGVTVVTDCKMIKTFVWDFFSLISVLRESLSETFILTILSKVSYPFSSRKINIFLLSLESPGFISRGRPGHLMAITHHQHGIQREESAGPGR